jgi:hypothetical protein
MLTFHVLVHGSASDIEAEMMDSLNGMITEIQNNDKELVRKTANICREERRNIYERNPLEACYHYYRSVCRLMQWAFAVQTVAGEDFIVCGPCVKLNVVYLTKDGLRTERKISVNATIKLKTLLWRLQDELKIESGDHQITLQDKCGLPKGSLIMKYSGDKTLNHIGFDHHDVLHIVNASIDLHGCTIDQALDNLNTSLPFWMDEAMKGSPLTVGVNT